jgi:hypothetical protein
MMRVRTVFSGWDGGPGLSTFYFTNTSENSTAAGIVVGRVHQFWADLVPVFAVGTAIDVDRNVDVLNPASGEVTNTLSVGAQSQVVGTGSSNAQAPASVAILMQLGTAEWVAGRRIRGRVFISPITSNAVSTTGKLASAMLGVLTPAASGLLASLPTENALCVWHRPKNGAGGSAVPVTTVNYPDKLAVLRSRRD